MVSKRWVVTLLTALPALFLLSSGCTNPFMEKILNSKSEAFVYRGHPGTGLAGDPFIVWNNNTLRRVGSEAPGPQAWDLSKHYKQICDIRLSDELWTPIGNSSAEFTGIYDGHGFAVRNFNITDNGNNSHQGMFGHIGVDGSNIGTVEGVSLVGVNIHTTGDTVGGVVGMNDGGKVLDCTTSGTINSSGDSIGGVVGYNDGGVVSGCNSSADLTAGPGNSIGGVVGGNSAATVDNCHSTGIVNSSGNNVGGVVGISQASSQIINCSFKGSVTGNQWVGGVVGQNNSSSTVENCYATGNVSGSSQIAGGVVGTNSGTVQNCYSTGDVSGGTTIGGVTGDNQGTTEYCFATGNVSGINSIGGVVGTQAGVFTIEIRNCVALNETITMISSDIGRVVGKYVVGQLNNNYARENMLILPSLASPDRTPNGKDGEDVFFTDTQNSSWWSTSPGWTINTIGNPGSPWEWDNTELRPKLYFE